MRLVKNVSSILCLRIFLINETMCVERIGFCLHSQFLVLTFDYGILGSLEKLGGGDLRSKLEF